MQFPCCLFAQAIPPNTTMLEFLMGSLGSMWSLAMLLSAGLIFAGAWRLVAGERPASALAAYLVLLPLPSLISLCGWMKGSIASLTAIAATPGADLSQSALAGGLASSLTSLLVAFVVTAPSYFVLVYGLLSRTLKPPAGPIEKTSPSIAPPPVAYDPKPSTIRPATST